MHRFFITLAVFFAFVAVPQIRAHELQPSFLELRETAPGTYSVLWKVPALPGLRDGLQPLFPPEAKITSPSVRTETSNASIERFAILFPDGISGRPLAVNGSAAAVADVLVRLERLDGSVEFFRITPAEPSVVVPVEAGPFSSDLAFLRLGIEHVLSGIDHLLFVLGLILLVRDRWMLLKTITAFTVAHSITLAIATLGYVSVPIPPLNACIALSILFLGPEILRFQRGETSFTIKRPWVVACAFGLLHGFGFASGLTSLGLPYGEIPWALLFFNIGVEVGQISFVILVLLLERSFRILEIRLPRWVESSPAYVVGGLGAYWTISLTSVMFANMR